MTRREGCSIHVFGCWKVGGVAEEGVERAKQVGAHATSACSATHQRVQALLPSILSLFSPAAPANIPPPPSPSFHVAFCTLASLCFALLWTIPVSSVRLQHTHSLQHVDRLTSSSPSQNHHHHHHHQFHTTWHNGTTRLCHWSSRSIRQALTLPHPSLSQPQSDGTSISPGHQRRVRLDSSPLHHDRTCSQSDRHGDRACLDDRTPQPAQVHATIAISMATTSMFKPTFNRILVNPGSPKDLKWPEPARLPGLS